MYSHRALVGLLLLSLTAAADARGQIPLLDRVFSNVSDLAVFVTPTGTVRDQSLTVGEPQNERDPWGLSGIGVEVFIPLGVFTRQDPASRPKTEWIREPTTVTVRTKADGTTVVRDSTVTLTKKETPARRDTVALLEIALGYSRLTRFRGFPGDSIDIRGSVEELPSVALYLNWLPGCPLAHCLAVYGGVRMGLSQLRGLRAVLDSVHILPGGVDSLAVGTLVNGGGTALHFGFAGGLTIGVLDRVELLGEAAYTWRNFRSVEWSAVGGRIPGSLPRDLDLGGLTISIGLQVELRKQD